MTSWQSDDTLLPVSTLRPGIVSRAIADLRDKALKEMDAPERGRLGNYKVRFDLERNTLPPQETPDFHYGAANYPGPNSPHIGNGSGGPR